MIVFATSKEIHQKGLLEILQESRLELGHGLQRKRSSNKKSTARHNIRVESIKRMRSKPGEAVIEASKTDGRGFGPPVSQHPLEQ